MSRLRTESSGGVSQRFGVKGSASPPRSQRDPLTLKSKHWFRDHPLAPKNWLLAGSSVLLFWVVIIWTVSRAYWGLPQVKPDSVPPTVFSAERAFQHLEAITGFGIRTVGNVANEIESPLYILEQIRQLQAQIQAEGEALDSEVQIDVQHPSGAFHTSFLGGFTNTYETVTNVVVRLSSRRHGLRRHALLLNAHWDSAIGSIAAADDTANVALLMELLRNTALNSSLPQHDLVFLFNGAEETNWQAAHGFITSDHPWVPDLRAVINLEAAGTGGRELVIQTGPSNPWISETYAASVPFPRASILAQSVFQAGIIPGETDFQVFSAFGGLVGIDFANIEDGYVYHTDKDVSARVPAAALQRTGENIQALTNELANSFRLSTLTKIPDDPRDWEYTIYFDIIGVAMISLSPALASQIALCSLACFALIVVLSKVGPTTLLKSMALALGTVLVNVMAALAVGGLLILLDLQLLWFKSPLLAITVFGGVAVASQLWLLSNDRIQRWCSKAKMMMDVARLEHVLFLGQMGVHLCLLMLFTVQGWGASYLFLVWTTSPLLARFLCMLMSALSRGQLRFSALWFGIHLSGLVIPTLLWFDVIFSLSDFLIPLTGRIGTIVPADLVVSATVALLASFILLQSISVLALLPKRLLRGISGAVLLAVVLFLAALALRRPFDKDHPKRIFMAHTRRTFHNLDDSGNIFPEYQDTGVWVNAMDSRRLPELQNIAELPEFHSPRRDEYAFPESVSKIHAEQPVYFNWPWYFPIGGMIHQGFYLDTPGPQDPADVPSRISLDHTEPSPVDPKLRRLHFTALGPDHMGFAVNDWPLGAKERSHPHILNGWSLHPEVPSPRRDCNCYWVFHSRGRADIHSNSSRDELDVASLPAYTPHRWSFWLDVPVGAQVRLSFWTHYLNEASPTVSSINSRLPEWVTSVNIISTFDSFVL